MPPFEVLLSIGILSFYIYDSCLLLHMNEFIVYRTSQGWKIDYPSGQLQLLRKQLYIPNPLCPARVLFKFTITPETNTGVSVKPCAISLPHSVSLSLHVLLFLLLILTPAALLLYKSESVLAILIIAIYSTIGFLLYSLDSQREKLALTKAMFLSLCLDSLLCPPFALNVARKIGRYAKLKGDPLEFGSSLLTAEEFEQFRGLISSRLEDQLSYIDQESDYFRFIRDIRARL